MLPLNNLHISQFRGIRDLGLENLGRINLLVGANNAGKTSVLDSVALYCRPLDIANWRDIARRREIKSARTPESEPFKWLFPQFAQHAAASAGEIHIFGNGQYPCARLVASYQEFEEFGQEPLFLNEPPAQYGQHEEDNSTNDTNRGMSIMVNVRMRPKHIDGIMPGAREPEKTLEFQIADNRRTAFPATPEEPALETAYISPYSHRTSHDTSWYFGRAIEQEGVNEHFRSDVLEVLRQIDPDVMDIDSVPKGKTTISLSVKHRLTGRTPIHALGDGFQRALLIASVIPAVRDGVLLIDELEASLHISALDNVLAVLKWAAEKYNVQVFATTHSLEAVDSVAKAFEKSPGQLIAYRLDTRGGRHEAIRYSAALLKEARSEMGMEIR